MCTITPELWEFVTKLTMSKNERKGRKAAIAQDTFAGKIKHLRRSYLLSVIMFLTNSECYSPFHVLLADAIECNGGSTELIKNIQKNRCSIICRDFKACDSICVPGDKVPPNVATE